MDISKNFYHEPINQDGLISHKFLLEVLHLHYHLTIYADGEARVVCTNFVTLN